MEIGYRFIEEILVISFYGELHGEQTDSVEFRVKELIKKADLIVVNCNDLEYVDSKGLGTLVKINTAIKMQEAELVICSVRGKVKKVFDLTRFKDYIKIFDELEEAVAYFKGKL